MKPCVIMRSHNDAEFIEATLKMVRRQAQPVHLINLDNASTDGTLEIIERYTDKLIHIPAGQYVPGRVLNQGMEASEGECVLFLNSDCTPLDENWATPLLEGLQGGAAAVFGRQLPRSSCWPLHAKDTEDTYGNGEQQANWKHCFSMASSGLRRSVWQQTPFSENLQYSEDIDWTWRIRQQGSSIRYIRDSKVYHSHNYNLSQFYKRHMGEGKAEAAIFDWSDWDRSFLRYSILPFARQILSDWKYCIPRKHFGSVCASPALRLSQMVGRRIGFRSGWRELRSKQKQSQDRQAA